MTTPNEFPGLPARLPPAAPFSDETELTLAQRRELFRRRYGREPGELAPTPAEPTEDADE